jgi:hypothetical protein
MQVKVTLSNLSDGQSSSQFSNEDSSDDQVTELPSTTVVNTTPVVKGKYGTQPFRFNEKYVFVFVGSSRVGK